MENLKFKFNYYLMELEMWWSNIWLSKTEKQKIKDSLKRRREQGGCSSWQQFLVDNPEHAKYAWEKEFIKKEKE
tara:strand:+ start:304 stop:525 length:222 start_codon:yes stop_codon:yes gene_type:complete